MSGKIIGKLHKCDVSGISNREDRTIWQCECGEYWLLMYVYGDVMIPRRVSSDTFNSWKTENKIEKT